MRLTKVLGAVGRVLVATGVLLLLFVAYQLWGTGIHEARAQDALAEELEATLADLPGNQEVAESPGSPTTTAPGTPPPTMPPLEEGDALARIAIPALGVEKVVVEGVSVADLKRGPGHFPDTPLPGQDGNVAIAGHRTTYGAPFHRIDELENGDVITLTTLQGSFEYRVSEQRIVAPDALEVLEDRGDARVTLVACHPKYSAAQRIVAVGTLHGRSPLPPDPGKGDTPGDGITQLPDEETPDGGGRGNTTGTAGGTSGDGGTGDRQTGDSEATGTGLSGDRASAVPAVLLGLGCALVWLAAWLAARVTRPWIAYAAGTPVFLVTLFFFFESTSRFLPANI